MELVAVADFPDSVVWMQILDSCRRTWAPELEFVRAVAVVVSLRHGPDSRVGPSSLPTDALGVLQRHAADCTPRSVRAVRRTQSS